ncbi:unnamed protein product [Penicillium palitans]
MRHGITPEKYGISALMARLQELLTSNTRRELPLLRSGSIQYCVLEDPRDIDDTEVTLVWTRISGYGRLLEKVGGVVPVK